MPESNSTRARGALARLAELSLPKAALIFAAVSAAVALGASALLPDAPTSPRPLAEYATKTLYTAFSGRSPRTLDPQLSYSMDESPYTYAICEPLYQYAYLKRPYVLEPRTATDLPRPEYYDKAGNRLPDDAAAESIAESRYVIHIRPGIQYAPHPAFAKDGEGKFLYHHLSAEEAARVRSPFDLPETGTRDLTARDYAWGIRRIASPRIVSPIFSSMASRIVGFTEYRKAISERWKAMQAEGAGQAAFLDLMSEPCAGVNAIDDHTLEIRVFGKDPQFPYWLAMTFFAPVPPEADAFYTQPGLRANNVSLDTWPVGTGAFRMAEFRENRRHVLEKNPLYRHGFYPCEGEKGDREAGLLEDCGKPLPLVDRIVFEAEKESMPLQTKFLAGYYDSPFLERVDSGLGFLVAMEDDPEKASLYTERELKFPKTVQTSLWYMGFNWLDPVVGAGKTPEEAERNRLLRQAIAIALDWEENIAIFQKNQGMPAHGPIPPGLFGWRDDGPSAFNPVVYEKDAEGRAQRRSIEEAKKLLAEAGYPDGRDAKTGVPLVLYFDYQNAAQGGSAYLEWFQRQFRKLGIQLEIRATDYNRFQEKMMKGAAQIFLWGWVADYPDAENFLFLFYGPGGKVRHQGENAANYENAEYDAAFRRMRLLEDGPEKAALIDRMIEIMQQDGPILFGYFPPGAAAFQSWVGNAKPSGMVHNLLQYYKVDAEKRVAKIAEWNHPVVWPLAVFIFALLMLVRGAAGLVARREAARLRPVPGGTASTDRKEAKKC
ncbi:ABC transporter substrate-binding protein [Sutterella sp.]|uniref:ABC transporter substrate-binding protein n=1 Tax=Sutterella sp. TaxID=1981025 RepID=UPI0026DF66E6|nr:ABC transporter substrate-binding protein [Sutterella sp.]MDO5530809.1 ABC transporter substrate-binding protein [Sutterella sp.]